MKSSGPKTDPCSTPQCTHHISDSVPLLKISCVLPVTLDPRRHLPIQTIKFLQSMDRDPMTQ